METQLTIVITIIGVGVALGGILWTANHNTEKRLIDNADKAHEAIGENIARVEGQVGKNADALTKIDKSVAVAQNDIAGIKNKLGGPTT